jgi:hypothetical protein
MKNVSDKIVEKINPPLLFPICPENLGVYELEKYGTARQATDENIAYAYCMLDTSSYKHTLRDYGFSTATIVTQARLHVTP